MNSDILRAALAAYDPNRAYALTHRVAILALAEVLGDLPADLALAVAALRGRS